MGDITCVDSLMTIAFGGGVLPLSLVVAVCSSSFSSSSSSSSLFDFCGDGLSFFPPRVDLFILWDGTFLLLFFNVASTPPNLELSSVSSSSSELIWYCFCFRANPDAVPRRFLEVML